MTFQNPNEVNEFLNTNDFDFTHIVNSKDYIRTFGTFGYPKTLILDKDLVIVEIEKMIPRDTENEEKNKAEFKARLSRKLTELKKR